MAALRPAALLLLALGSGLAAGEVQLVYPQAAPDTIAASSVLPDTIDASSSTVAAQVITTKTVFGFDDFVTTVDRTVMVFTPDPAGQVQSPALLPQSQMPSSPALALEKMFQLEEEAEEQNNFIKVSGGRGTGAPPSIRPSKVESEVFIHSSTLVMKEPETRVELPTSDENKIEASDELETEEIFDFEELLQPPQFSEENLVDTTLEVEADDDSIEENDVGHSTGRGRQRSRERQVAGASYKERLKARLAKEKAKLAVSRETIGQRRSFSSDESLAAGGRTRLPRARNRFRSQEEDQETARSSSGGRSRTRASRARSQEEESPRSSGSGRGRSFKSKIRETIRELASGTDAPKVTTSPRPRFTPGAAKERAREAAAKTDKPKIVFKKFNRFDRPDRRALLRSKLFGIRNPFREKQHLKSHPKEEPAEERPEEDNEIPEDSESSQSALVISNFVETRSDPELPLSRLQTTLHTSTVYHEETPGKYLEIATIRSPYTFNVEDDQKSTRYITVTRTNTKSAEISASSTFTLSSEASSISPTPSSTLKHTALFDTASIPAPENILAETPDLIDRIDVAIEGSSDIEVLPPLILASSLHHATPPLETVTESFTTDEVVIKKSVLPVVMGTDTSFLTLSQTYSITKIVTAIKTVPPMELYEFSPEHSFADFDNLFEEAGSENRESLLPGELEFSDQDNFGLGPTPIRVAPPQGFLEVGGLDGEKQKLIHHQKQHNPEIFDLNQPPPTIHSSFFQPESPSAQAPTQASGLDLGALSGLGVTPEQLLYLQLLQNPLAALGLGKQVVTESSPVYKTEPVVESSVLQLFLGAKEFFTTLTSTVGFTTKTDYVLSTRSVSGGGLGGLGGLQPHAPQGLFGGFGGQRVKVISSPVTRNTVFTEYNTEELKVIFRNRPTYTTLTSTTLVTSQVVSYVTQTVTANPLSGLLG